MQNSVRSALKNAAHGPRSRPRPVTMALSSRAIRPAGSTDVSSLRFTWPAFVCLALDEGKSDVCGLRARWRSRPLATSATWWTYCDHHRPAGAELIPDDAAFRVTRLTVTVAVVSMQELREEAAIEASLRVRHALEGAAAAVVRVHVHGRLTGTAGLEPSPFRLLLAGPGEPLERGRLDIWMPPADERWRRQARFRRIPARRRPQERRTDRGPGVREGSDPARPTEAANAPGRRARRKGAA